MRNLTENTLFSEQARRRGPASAPLADRMRPRTLSELLGQAHLVGDAKPLAQAIAADRLPSLILWGPPGVGKTSLGHVIASATKSVFIPFSAVLGGLPELRTILADARERRDYRGEKTIVFVDEIHRFNKGQQDAFLPHVESGVITMIGATTENPSFSVNSALLSRCKVVRLHTLNEADLCDLLARAIVDVDRGLGALSLTFDDEAIQAVAKLADGDARRALSMLEAIANFLASGGSGHIDRDVVFTVNDRAPILYDKRGEERYNVVSAFIKSMRGSDPDAAIYWMMRMLDAGEEPLFVLRRMIIFASEDIGLADSRALLVATAADEAFRRLGMPEGLYPMAQAALYLATAPKSNSTKNAWQRARELVAERGALAVPMKLRNAPTRLMKEEGYGEGYRYAHDYDDGVVPGERYLPDELSEVVLYEPTPRGEEGRIAERLARLRGNE